MKSLVAAAYFAVLAVTPSPAAADDAAVAPLADKVALRLAGSQRFRAVLEVRNGGDSSMRQFRYAMLVADGSLAPAPGGFAWQFDLTRVAVDARTLGDGKALASVRLLTDDRWSVLATATRVDPAVHAASDAVAREMVLAATEMLAAGFGVLPEAPLGQGTALPAYDDAIRALLAWGWQDIGLVSPGPELRVVGSRQLFGRRTLLAAGKAPVAFASPLGKSSLQADAQREIALDSALPLVTAVRLTGDLPGAYRLDSTIRVTLRPL